VVAAGLAGAGLPMVVVNPAHVRAFAQARGKRAKTDPMKYSAGVTNVARPSSRRIFHSRNGPPSSVASVSLARFSIASRIMSIFWSCTARATGSSNRRQGGGVTRGPPTRPLQLPIQKPAIHHSFLTRPPRLRNPGYLRRGGRGTSNSTPSRKLAWFCSGPLAGFYFGVDNVANRSKRHRISRSDFIIASIERRRRRCENKPIVHSIRRMAPLR
jgi:hypothetical protein